MKFISILAFSIISFSVFARSDFESRNMLVINNEPAKKLAQVLAAAKKESKDLVEEYAGGGGTDDKGEFKTFTRALTLSSSPGKIEIECSYKDYGAGPEEQLCSFNTRLDSNVNKD